MAHCSCLLVKEQLHNLYAMIESLNEELYPIMF